MSASPDPWVSRLQTRAASPPARRRERLGCGGPSALIGSIEPELARRIAAAGLPIEQCPPGWHIAGPVDASLAGIARWLHANGLCSRWRDELLAVESEDGETVGCIERAAARALGLTTRAVHLVGRTADGRTWVQQRAFDKATDPGLWDTLMGGLVAAGESTADTLARETREEAGLAIEELQGVAASGRITVRRPVWDGYMVEHIDVFEAIVPEGTEPLNRDGEVERFARIDAGTLTQWLQADAFTLEAALILVRPPARFPRLS